MSDIDDFAADLFAHGARAGVMAFTVTRTYGQIMLARAKRNASAPRSRPPGAQLRLQTGALVRSMNLRMSLDGGSPTASVGTNIVYARRHEFGFTGPDSLGRMISTPPRPFLAPALAATADEFLAALAAIPADLK